MRPTGDGFTHMVTMDTPYFASGPVPTDPPEGVLRAGIRVRILEQAGSHTRVETEDGIRGYVASDALACDATLRA